MPRRCSDISSSEIVNDQRLGGDDPWRRTKTESRRGTANGPCTPVVMTTWGRSKRIGTGAILQEGRHRAGRLLVVGNRAELLVWVGKGARRHRWPWSNRGSKLCVGQAPFSRRAFHPALFKETMQTTQRAVRRHRQPGQCEADDQHRAGHQPSPSMNVFAYRHAGYLPDLRISTLPTVAACCYSTA